jgi:hypothetical protein
MYSIECNDLLGYTMRKIEPAKNYDVVSFARAMNQDFAPRLKKIYGILTCPFVQNSF